MFVRNRGIMGKFLKRFCGKSARQPHLANVIVTYYASRSLSSGRGVFQGVAEAVISVEIHGYLCVCADFAVRQEAPETGCCL